jgi:hypothetical protein
MTKSYLFQTPFVRSTKVNNLKYLQEKLFRTMEHIVSLIPKILVIKSTFNFDK